MITTMPCTVAPHTHDALLAKNNCDEKSIPFSFQSKGAMRCQISVKLNVCSIATFVG